MRKKITHEQYKIALQIVYKYQTQIEVELKTTKEETSRISKFSKLTKDSYLEYGDISTRLLHILWQNMDCYSIDGDKRGIKIRDLENLSENLFMKFKNSGDKTLQELKELCYYTGINLLP